MTKNDKNEKPKKAKFDQEKGMFKESFSEHRKRSPNLVEKITKFRDAKEHRPPLPLPNGFNDHKLGGVLAGLSECHLAEDSCLIYTDKNDVVTTIIIVNHDQIIPGSAKEKALAQKLSKHLEAADNSSENNIEKDEYGKTIERLMELAGIKSTVV